MFESLSKKSTQFFARRKKLDLTLGSANVGLAAFTVADFMLTGGTISVGSVLFSGGIGAWLMSTSTSNKYKDGVYKNKTYRLDHIHYNTFQTLANRIEDKRERLQSGSTRNPKKLAKQLAKLEEKMEWILEGRLKSDLIKIGQEAAMPKKPPPGRN